MKQAHLGSRFDLPLHYQLVAPEKIGEVFSHGGWWEDYYKKYPESQGYLAVSRVGFSPDGKHALFYVTNNCGAKCGTGAYVVMEKSGLVWIVVKEVLVWIS